LLREGLLHSPYSLAEARHIYQKAGFTLVAQGAHHSFGHDLVEETWELAL
jgi:hypothetical protein